LNYKKTLFALLGWVGVLCFSMTVGAAPPKVNPTGFNQDMRKLWEDHITWTRLYIVNALNDLPSKESTADRLCETRPKSATLSSLFMGTKRAKS